MKDEKGIYLVIRSKSFVFHVMAMMGIQSWANAGQPSPNRYQIARKGSMSSVAQ